MQRCGAVPFCTLRDQFPPRRHHQTLTSAPSASRSHRALLEPPLSVLCHNQGSICKQKTHAILRFISCIFQGLMLFVCVFFFQILNTDASLVFAALTVGELSNSFSFMDRSVSIFTLSFLEIYLFSLKYCMNFTVLKTMIIFSIRIRQEVEEQKYFKTSSSWNKLSFFFFIYLLLIIINVKLKSNNY